MLDNPDQGEVADRQRVIGFFTANTVGRRQARCTKPTHTRYTRVLTTLYNLRQQVRVTGPASPTGRWVTTSRPRTTGLADYVGASRRHHGARQRRQDRRVPRQPTTTTTGSAGGRSPTGWPRRSPKRMQPTGPQEFWGFQPDEQLDTSHSSVRSTGESSPAPGYPACPEHTEKGDALAS